MIQTQQQKRIRYILQLLIPLLIIDQCIGLSVVLFHITDADAIYLVHAIQLIAYMLYAGVILPRYTVNFLQHSSIISAKEIACLILIVGIIQQMIPALIFSLLGSDIFEHIRSAYVFGHVTRGVIYTSLYMIIAFATQKRYLSLLHK